MAKSTQYLSHYNFINLTN